MFSCLQRIYSTEQSHPISLLSFFPLLSLSSLFSHPIHSSHLTGISQFPIYSSIGLLSFLVFPTKAFDCVVSDLHPCWLKRTYKHTHAETQRHTHLNFRPKAGCCCLLPGLVPVHAFYISTWKWQYEQPNT